jgi:outer membrane lipoprotein carrier protein
MKQQYFWSFLLLSAIGIAGCGGAEQVEARPDPGASPVVEEPAADGDTGLPGDATTGSEIEPSTPAAAELPASQAPLPARAGAPATDASAPAASATAVEQQSAAANPADEILRRVELEYARVRSMEADFVQQLTVPLLGESQRSEGRLYQRRPDRFLMRFTDPAGDIMVADGRHFWLYTPSVDRTQVLRTRMGEGGAQVDLQQEFLSNPTQRFVATLVGTERLNGRATHLLSLVPRERSQYRLLRVWVDQQDHLVRRFELTEENESVRRLELRNLRLNPDLPDSLFEFTPPAGTQVFDQ